LLAARRHVQCMTAGLGLRLQSLRTRTPVCSRGSRACRQGGCMPAWTSNPRTRFKQHAASPPSRMAPDAQLYQPFAHHSVCEVLAWHQGQQKQQNVWRAAPGSRPWGLQGAQADKLAGAPGRCAAYSCNAERQKAAGEAGEAAVWICTPQDMTVADAVAEVRECG